jgi:hypothetical protein
MHTYYLIFGLFIITANFGYAFGQLGKGKIEVFSVPLFLVTVAISAACLTWIHKRMDAVRKKREANFEGSAAPERAAEPRLNTPVPSKD